MAGTASLTTGIRFFRENGAHCVGALNSVGLLISRFPCNGCLVRQFMARRIIGDQSKIGCRTAEAGLLSAGIAFDSLMIASARFVPIKREFALCPPLLEQMPALIQLHLYAPSMRPVATGRDASRPLVK
jgi:hypothetical protein